MANTFKNAMAENISDSSAATVFTVPSGNASRAVLVGVQLTNTGSSEIKATVILHDYSASTNDITLINQVPIPANSMVSVLSGDKVILEEQDAIKILSDTASALNGFISYLLVDTT